MRKSRAIRIVLSIVAVTALAACSPSTTPSPKPTASPSPTPIPTPVPTPTPRIYTYNDLVVGFIAASSDPGWVTANLNSFKRTAILDGVTLQVTDSQDKIENQLVAFTKLDADPKINVIVLEPVAATGYDAALKAARAAGKIVVVEGRPIDSDPSLYYTFVGADYVAEGQKAADAMCAGLAASKKKRVVEISGIAGDAATIGRAKGFRDHMASCGIRIVASGGGAWTVPGAKAQMESFTATSKDFQGVFAHSDEMAIGAVAALKEFAMAPGRTVFMVGFDGTADGFAYLMTGQLNVDVEYNPLLAPQVYGMALRALNGDTTAPKFIASLDRTFTSSMGVAALKAFLAGRDY